MKLTPMNLQQASGEGWYAEREGRVVTISIDNAKAIYTLIPSSMWPSRYKNQPIAAVGGAAAADVRIIVSPTGRLSLSGSNGDACYGTLTYLI